MAGLKKDKGNSLLEVRRIFPVIAGLLMLAAIFLPMWSVAMTAPQYPEQDLEIRIYTNKMEGDIDEYNTLNQYVGVSFPDYLLEFEIVPYLLAGFGAVSILIGIGPQSFRKPGLAILLVLFTLMLIGGVADLQYRLYVIGHDLDPSAPMQGIGTFTPPILGPNKVWNFSTLSLVRSGGIALGAALLLILTAFLNRSSDIQTGPWVGKQKARFKDRFAK